MTHDPSPSSQAPGPGEPPARNMTRTYVRVLLIQFVVLITLWLFSRYFG